MLLPALVALALLIPKPSSATVPDPAHSTLPAAFVVGSGGCCFDLVIRDFANNTIPGVLVDIDFGSCAVSFCPTQPPGIGIAGSHVSTTTDVNGLAHFCICGSWTGPSCMATLTVGTTVYGRFPAQGCDNWATGGVAICLSDSDQTFPAITGDGAGGAIIAWQDHRNSFDYDIYAQHILASGAVDANWPVNGRALCTAGFDQRAPVITTDDAGGAIVAWQDFRNGSNYDIYAQHVLASGAVDGNWPLNGRALCTAAGNQQFPVIASAGGGPPDGAIVAWDDSRAGNHDVYAQFVTGSGTVSWTVDGVGVCTASGDQEHPSIDADGGGGAFIAWEDLRSGTSYDVYVQRLEATGALAPGWPVNGSALCTAAGNQRATAITADQLGEAIVTWQDRRSGTQYDIYAQRVGPSGTPDNNWPVNGRGLCTAAHDQLSPRIVGDDEKGAIVTWQDARSGSGSDVYAEHVLMSGAVDGNWPPDGRALSTASGDQALPVIATDESGGAIVAWYDFRNGATADIYAQHVLANGAVDGGWQNDGSALCTSANTQAFPAITSDGSRGAIIAWHDLRNGNNYDVYAQHVSGTIFFNGASNSPIGGSTLIRASGDTLRVLGIGSSGGDGVAIALPDGVSEIKTRFELPNESSLSNGAYLEVSSREQGSAPGDSLGFIRMTRLPTPGQYAYTSAIAGASEKIVAVYRAGQEVYRDQRSNLPTASDVRTVKGLSSNDDVGDRPLGPGAPLSPLILRWQWADTAAIAVVDRPAGAPDTTVTGDEVRIIQVDPPSGNYAPLSEFRIRGKDLGELRILAETTNNVGVRTDRPRAGGLWFAPPAPNPSPHGSGVFTFRLARAERVSIEISDVAGRRIASRAAEIFSPGSHVLNWGPHLNSPGLYLVRLATGSGESFVRRWVVLK
jgi:hypothetical protein